MTDTIEHLQILKEDAPTITAYTTPAILFDGAIEFVNSLRRVLPNLPQPRITTVATAIHLVWKHKDKIDGKNKYFNIAIREHDGVVMAFLPTNQQFYKLEVTATDHNGQELISVLQSYPFFKVLKFWKT